MTCIQAQIKHGSLDLVSTLPVLIAIYHADIPYLILNHDFKNYGKCFFQLLYRQ